MAERDGGELRQSVIDRVADQRESAEHTFGIEWCVTEVDAVTEGDFAVREIESEAAGLALLLVGPFSGTPVGLTVFAVSSFRKDAVTRIGDLADDGKPNDSFKS